MAGEVADQSCLVVVGASLAGASAVEELRRAGFAGRVVLVGAERHLPYERPVLSKGLLTGATPEAKVFLRDAAFYAEQRVDLRLDAAAVGLDVTAHMLWLANGEHLRWDGLLIATGGHALGVAVPGADLPGVVSLRTLDDARTLRTSLVELAAHGGRVVIVGGGFIGAEVAAACRQLGIAVTVLDVLPVMLGRALGPEMGAVCARIHQAHGVELRLGEGIAAARGTGRVEEVVTTAGHTLACDLLLVGVGMRPTDAWLRQSGVALRDGVLVDAFCATNVPGIYAAGDVARWPYPVTGELVRLEHEDNALRQGAVAARNLLGQQQAYAPVPYFWSDQYDLKLQYVGHAASWDQVVVRGQPPTAPFIACYLRAGKVRAALAVNQVREVATLKKLIAAEATPDPAALADPSVALKSLLPTMRQAPPDTDA